MSEDIPKKQGERQGYVLSLILFNLYSGFIFGEALNEVNEGIKVNDKLIQ